MLNNLKSVRIEFLRFVVGVTFASLVLLLVAGPQPGVAQEAAKIVRIDVTGNVNINADTVLGVVRTKVGDIYDKATADKDGEAIRELGYFSSITHRTEPDPGGVALIFEVMENPKITEIKVSGSDPLAAHQIVGVMKLKVGMVYNDVAMRRDVEAVQNLYVDDGYLAVITEESGLDEENPGVLKMVLLAYKVDSIEITGNKKTRSYIFTREMKTIPGAYFNARVMNEDLRRILNLDILEEVKQYEMKDSKPGFVKVTLPVVEKKTGQVSIGAGYSSRQKLVGQVRIMDSNFRGRAQAINMLWEQGTSAGVSGGSSYEIGFVEPWLDKKRTSLSVNAFNKLQYRFSSGVFGGGSVVSDQTYNERRRGGDLTLGRPLSEYTRGYVGLRFESVKTDRALLEGAADLAAVVQNGDVSGVSFRVEQDKRDFRVSPAAGGFTAASFEIGSVKAVRFDRDPITSLLTEVPFSGGFNKGSIDVRRYFSKGGRKKTPQDKRLTLATRFRLGMSSGKLPFFEQFFVGGAESLRGYREDRFWGTKMLVANTELRVPITQGFNTILFVDFGDAWESSEDLRVTDFPQNTKFRGNLSGGIGVGFETPMGLIRLDYGVGREGSRTHFNIGQSF